MNKKDVIKNAALEEFYTKGYMGTTMRGIATSAGISTGLTYAYYENKEQLFNEIIEPVMNIINRTFEKTAQMKQSERMVAEKNLLAELLKWHRELVILVDKSTGSKYENIKERFISILQKHISTTLKKYHKEHYKSYALIVACNYIESIMIIARNYKNKKWAVDMSEFVNKLLFFKSVSDDFLKGFDYE